MVGYKAQLPPPVDETIDPFYPLDDVQLEIDCQTQAGVDPSVISASGRKSVKAAAAAAVAANGDSTTTTTTKGAKMIGKTGVQRFIHLHYAQPMLKHWGQMPGNTRVSLASGGATTGIIGGATGAETGMMSDGGMNSDMLYSGGTTPYGPGGNTAGGDTAGGYISGGATPVPMGVGRNKKRAVTKRRGARYGGGDSDSDDGDDEYRMSD